MDIFKAHSPRCDGERNCSVHGGFDEPWECSDGRNTVNGQIGIKKGTITMASGAASSTV